MKVKVKYEEIVPKSEKFANWKLGIEIEMDLDVFDDIADLQAQARYLVLQEKIRVMRSEGEDVDEIIELSRRTKPKGSSFLSKLVRG